MIKGVILQLQGQPFTLSHTDVFNTLIMSHWGSDIKTCRSHTAASAQGRASDRGWRERDPLLAETGIHPPPDKRGSQECCSRSDRLLRRRASLRAGVRLRKIKGACGRQREVLSPTLSQHRAVMRNLPAFARTPCRKKEENALKKQSDGLAGRRLTTSVCHAVEKEPGAGPGAVFDEAHVVAGVNAEHGEQFHHVPGDGAVGGSTRCCRQRLGGVTLTGGMSVHLEKQEWFPGCF